MFGSRHTCLVSGLVLVSCRGSDTHAPGLILLSERAVSSLLRSCAPLSVCISYLHFAFSCSEWHGACVFHWLCAFMFVMFCMNTQLVSLLISCVFVSRFAHG